MEKILRFVTGLFAVAALLTGFSAPSYAQSFTDLPPQFSADTVVDNLADPVNLVTLPDGRMMVLEKAGRVKIFDPTDAIIEPQIILGIGAIQTAGERGLASIALDPNFSENGYFYLYYTQLGNGNRNRLSRFTFNFETDLASGELLVWEDNEEVTECCHFGGGLDFGPDGMLYLATGEEFDGPQAQDLTRAGGKIMRLNVSNLDTIGPWVRNTQNLHIIPDDNPAEIMDGPGPNLDEIWAYGLRNPYRAHWDLESDPPRFYLGEVGGNVQETATEDLHIGRAGANYGWPLCEGECVNEDYDDPLYFYFHEGASPIGGAITAGVVYRGSLFPPEYNEAFFFADYAVGFMRYMTFNPDGSVNTVNEFADNVGPIVAIEQGPDEALYAVDYVFGQIVRISYDSGNQRPVIQDASASVSVGPAPLDVDFTAIATDAEDDTLTYQWVFGDGNEAFGPTVTHTYTEQGLYNAVVIVSDAEGSRTSNNITIQVGDPPVAVIDFPLEGDTFVAGQVIPFSGSNSGNSTNGPYEYDWNIKFFHNAHIHPGLSSSEQTGQLTVNDSGHDYHDDTGFELTLTVTDAFGLTDNTTVRVFPQKVNLNFATSPVNLPITLDGLPLSTPIQYDTLIDFNHVVSVPESLCFGGNEFTFTSWSNGGTRTQIYQVPNVESTLSANFTNQGPCTDIPTNGLVAQFESTLGVETTGDISFDGSDPITTWQDLSGNGNDLNLVEGNPGLLPDGFNGNAVVAFDGIGDLLKRTDVLTGFPFNASDRTVFMLAKYNTPGPGGFAYGLPGNNRVFGLHVSDTGLLRIHGFGAGRDFVSEEPGTNAGWFIQNATVDSNILTHYRNNTIIDVQENAFFTRPGAMIMGADMDEDPTLDMQVAAVLVYNRVLSETERLEVIDYLEAKFFTLDGNPVPVANNDNIGVANGGSVVIDVLANDEDDTAFDLSSIEITQLPGAGTAVKNDTTGTITYTHNGVSAVDSFIYTVADPSGARSNPATVSIFLSEPGVLVDDGLVAHYQSDVGVQQTGGLVTGWLDQSGQGNDLTTLGDVTFAPSILGDQAAIVFDGDVDLMERVGNISGFPTGNQNRSVYMVVRYSSPGFGGFGYGESATNQLFGLGLDPSPTGKLAVQGFGPGNDFLAINDGVDEGWIIQSAVVEDDILRHFENGTLIDIRNHEYNTADTRIVLGAELDGSPQVEMEVGAVLVYDRALDVIEQQRVQNYLQVKYAVAASNNLPPITKRDNVIVELNSSVVIDVLANDTDPGGEVDVRSVVITTPPSAGTVAVNAVTGVVTYTHVGPAETDTFFYTVSDDIGQASQPTEVKVRVGIPADLPMDELISYYESDVLVDTVTGDNVVRWQDQNGTFNNDFTGRGDELFGAPKLIDDALNGLPVIRFDGQDDALVREGILAGYINQDRDRSLYLVVSYKSPGAGFAYGVTQQNRRFGLGTAADGDLRVSGGGPANDFETDIPGVGTGWFVHGADVIDGVMYHRVDNMEAGTFVHEYNTEFEGIAVFGAGMTLADFTEMDIAAAYVYGKALSDGERDTLHLYLRNKYDLAAANIPVARNDEFSIVASSVNTLDILDNDTDDLGLNLSSIAIVSPPTGGNVVVNPVSGTVTYTHDGVSTDDSFTYTVADFSGNTSPEATVTLLIDTDLSPIAIDDMAGVGFQETVQINVLENDQDDFGLDPTSVAMVQAPLNGTVLIDDVTGIVSYTHSGVGSMDSFTYVVLDTAGQVSNVATVDIEVVTPGDLPTLGLVAQFESTDGLVTAADGRVISWTDQSVNGIELLGVGDPVLTQDVLGDNPAIVLDGMQDRLQILNTALPLPLGDNNRTVFFLAKYEDNGPGGFTYGSAANNAAFGVAVNIFGNYGTQGYGAGNDFFTNVEGNGAGWAVQSAMVSEGVITQFIDGVQIDSDVHDFATAGDRIMIGAEISTAPQLAMQVGAALIYDRALSVADRQRVEDYLRVKYQVDTSNNLSPVAIDDTQRVPPGAAEIINVLANDSDDGTLVPSTVTIVTPPTGGSAVANPVTGAITYSHNGVTLSDSFTYTVQDDFGQVSNIAEVVITIGNPLILPDLSGLVFHIEADDLVTTDGGTGAVTLVADRSLQGNDLSGVGDVTVIADGLNGFPVLDFDGDGDALVRTGNLSGLPLGSSARTAYQIVRYDSVGSGGFGYGQRANNRTFGLHVQGEGLLRINGFGGGNDYVSTTLGTGAGWIIQKVVYDGTEAVHFVNGQEIDRFTHTFNTQVGPIVLGADLDQVPFVDMQLAAVLMYNRALSSAEQSQLEGYLNEKFNVLTAGAPIANADSLSVPLSGTEEIAVLANDIAVEDGIDASSVEIVQEPTEGTATVDAVTGVITYTATSAVAALDSFTYRVANNSGRYSQDALVSIEIDDDLSPTAVDDNAQYALGGTIDIDVLDNDLDDNGLIADTVTIVSGPSGGSATVDTLTGFISYTHGGAVLSDSLVYTVSDSSGQVSNEATVTLTFSVTPTLPPGGGLVLQLEGDIGVVVQNDVVTSWEDQSGQGNNLTFTGDPRVVTDELLSPVIELDGAGDRLERLGSLVGLPQGSSDRTIIAAVNYLGTGFGGIAWGTPANNEAFGLAVNNFGRLAVQGFGAGNDFISTTLGTDEGWLLHSAIVSSNQVTHAVDGEVIGVRAQTYNTGNARIMVGAGLSGGPQVNMQVGAVLVYDRALSEAELIQVRSYLDSKYGVSVIGDPAPVAVDDEFSVAGGSTTVLDVLVNDSDLAQNGDPGAINPSTVFVTQQPVNGTVIVDSATGAITYQNSGAGSGDVFRYTVRDTLGQESNEAVVTVSTLPLAGLVLHIEADALVTDDGTGAVTEVGDRSVEGNVLSGVGDVTVVPDALNGRPVFDFDGNGDALERTDALSNFPFGSEPRTVYQVVRYDSAGSGGFGYGLRATNSVFGLHVQGPSGLLRINGFGAGSDFVSSTLGNGAGWIIQSAVYDGTELVHEVNGEEIDRFVHTFNTQAGPLVLGADLDQNPYVDMQLASLHVYDRALSEGEQNELEAYLNSRFAIVNPGNAPVATDDDITLASGETVTLAILENDTSDAGLDVNTLALVGTAVNGVVSFDPATQLLTYIHDGVGEGDTLTYQISDLLGQASNTATITFVVGNSAPVALDDTASVAVAGGSVDINVLENDTDDTATDPTTVVIDTQPAFGAAVVDAITGIVTYTHNGGTEVSDSFTYSVSDGEGVSSNIATVLVSIAGADAAPVANNDTFTISSGTTTLDVVNNDTDDFGIDGSTIVIVDFPVNGTVVVNTVDGSVDYEYTGPGFSDQFTYTVEDTSSQVSNVATVDLINLPVDSLVLHLEADNAVTLDGSNSVLEITDRSPEGNTLTGIGSVSITPNALNQNPVLSFDGIEDALINNAVTGFPYVATPRTMYQLVQYESAGSGGIGYGERARNKAFGLHVQGPDGVLRVNGFGPTGDFVSDYVGNGAGWIIHSAVYDGNELVHEVNGVEIDRFNHQFNTRPGPLVIGADLDQVPYVDMNVAAVFVYDKALSEAEQLVLEDYLDEKYGLSGGTDPEPPVTVADSATVLRAGSVVVDVLVNDSDDNAIAPSTVQITVDPAFGTLIVDAVTGAVTYTHNGGAENADTFSYVVSDVDGLESAATPVTITIEDEAINEAPVAQDDTAPLVAVGGSIGINVLSNDTDDTAVDPTSVNILTPPSFGAVDVDAVTGLVTYTHNGGAELSDSFTYTVSDDEALVSNIATVSVTIGEVTDLAPVANNDSFTISGAGTTTLDVLINDTDDIGIDATSVQIVDSPVNGTLLVDAVNGSIDYEYTGPGFGDSFTYTVADSIGQVSNVATVQLNNLPLTGLVLHLEADNAATLDGSDSIVEITDRSAEGNTLTGIGSVSITPNALNQKPVLSFDGIEDALTNALPSGFPYVASPRTMYQVVQYESAGSGGVGYGERKWNKAFGLHVQAPSGVLRINGFGPTGDFVSDYVGTGAGWITHSAVYDGTELVHEVDGVEIDRFNHQFNTRPGPLIIGADLDQVPYVDMNLAALFVYDRALSESEQLVLEGYLNEKYGLGGGTDPEPPVTVADSATVLRAGSVVVDVLVNDSDDNAIAPSTVQITADPAFGTLIVDAVTGAVTYTHNGGAENQDTFSYVVSDVDGLVSAATLVTITIEGTDPEPPVTVADSAIVLRAGSVVVDVLVNDSDDNAIAPSTVQITVDPAFGTLIVDAVTGAVTYTHNGGAENDDTFSYVVSDVDGLESAATPVTIAIEDEIVNAAPVAQDDTAVVVGVGGLVDINVLLNDTDDTAVDPTTVSIATEPQFGTLVVDGASGLVSYTHNGTAELSDSFTYTVSDGEAAVSNIATVSVTIQDVGADEPPVANNDSFTVAGGSVTTLDILVNDTDDVGINGSSIVIVDFPVNGTVVVNAADGTVNYQHTGPGFGDEFAYTVADSIGQVSNVATVQVANLPLDSLVLHLEADNAVTLDGSDSIVEITDRSVQANTLTGIGSVSIIPDGLNQKPVLSFDGIEDALTNALPTGFPYVATPRTIYQVVQYESVGSGGAGYGERARNKAFGLHVQGPTGVLRINGFGPTGDFVSDYVGTGAGWITQSAVYDGNELVHEVDGVEIDRFNHQFNTRPGPLVIGADLDQVPYVAMKLAALFVFDKALSETEQLELENYLDEKYALSGGGTGPEAPVTVADAATVLRSGSVVVDILENDSDDNAIAPSTVQITVDPSFGTLLVDPTTGAVTYSHSGGAENQDTFSYVVSDVDGLESAATPVTITIEDEIVNAAPVAVDDNAQVAAPGGAANVNVLLNDTDDTAIDPTSVVIVTQPSFGTAAVNVAGVITYNHDGSAEPSDSFTYTVSDGEDLVSNVATVSVAISGTGPDAPPVANNDSYTVAGGSVTELDVLVNDTDDIGINGSSIVIVDFPVNGTVVINAVDGTVNYEHTGPGFGDEFIYTVADSSGQISNQATVQIANLPLDALVLHLEADNASTLDGSGSITEITDRSAQANTLTGIGSVSILPNGLNQKPVLSFDGVEDALTNALPDGFPYVAAPRTIYQVVQYESAGSGGVGYGERARNKAFGLHVQGPTGVLRINGFGPTGDFVTDYVGNGAGWITQSAVYNGTELVHEVNGVEIDSFNHQFNTRPGPLVIGADLDQVPYVAMKLAALLVYDKALSEAEQLELESYLDEKYGVSGGGGGTDPEAPVTLADAATVLRSGSVVVDVLENDSDDNAIAPSTVVITVDPSFGTLLVDATTGAVTYTHSGGPENEDTFSYVVSDVDGLVSAATPVTITIEDEVANAAPVAGDDTGFVATAGGSVDINVLTNDTDDTAVDPTSVTILAQPSFGSAAVNAVSGVVTYTHDGGAEVGDSFTYTVSDGENEVSNVATVSITIGAVTGDDAPVANDDSFTVAGGSVTTLDVLVNDTDDNGINNSSIVIVDSPVNGTVVVNAANGTVTYEHTGPGFGDEFVYTVADSVGQVSNQATVDIANLPLDSLVLHIEADNIATLDGSDSIVTLSDKSPQANTLTGIGSVSIVPDGLNQRAILSFDGVEDALINNALSGFPYVASPRTLYQVVQYESVGSGGMGYGERKWNKAFGLHVQGPTGVLRINGFGPTGDFVSDYVGTGAGWITQSAVYDGNELVHEVDGIEIDRFNHQFNTRPGPLVIGADLDQVPYVDMNLAAVFVYDKALSEAEQLELESYLEDKYGLAAANAASNNVVASSPTTLDDTAVVLRSGSTDIDVLDNDSDEADLAPATLFISAPPSSGTLLINTETGVVSYTHNGDDAVSDAFSYTVSNVSGLESAETDVTITIEDAD